MTGEKSAEAIPRRPETRRHPPSAAVSLNHDGTDGSESDGTGIQSVSPVPSASAAGPSVPSVSNSRSN